MSQNVKRLDALLKSTPVVPVLLIDDSKKAVPLARAIAKGGINLIEVTLRTKAGIDSIKAIRNEVEGMTVGAGTVLTAKQCKDASQSGAAFIVTPGYTTRLLDIAGTRDIPMIPGVSSVSESMFLIERAYTRQKFFPAESSGGVSFLSAVASPLPDVKFFPTGGITLSSAPKYLALSNVACVGGSWIAPRELVEKEDWKTITKNAENAAKLR